LSEITQRALGADAATGHVRVDHRRFQPFVAEKLLNGSDVVVVYKINRFAQRT
jgi:hypothetical protein